MGNLQNIENVEVRFLGKRTYTVDEIQDILDISRTTAYSLVKRNLFHSVRIGGHIRISKNSFDAWLDAEEENVKCANE